MNSSPMNIYEALIEILSKLNFEDKANFAGFNCEDIGHFISLWWVNGPKVSQVTSHLMGANFLLSILENDDTFLLHRSFTALRWAAGILQEGDAVVTDLNSCALHLKNLSKEWSSAVTPILEVAAHLFLDDIGVEAKETLPGPIRILVAYQSQLVERPLNEYLEVAEAILAKP